MSMPERVRTVVFSPYREGCGPKFRLVMWDEQETDSRGYWITGVELYEIGNREPLLSWRGADGVSDPYAVDSDHRLRGAMAFLTVTEDSGVEDEFFRQYSKRALAYRDQHAEALACEVASRFGSD